MNTTIGIFTSGYLTLKNSNILYIMLLYCFRHNFKKFGRPRYLCVNDVTYRLLVFLWAFYLATLPYPTLPNPTSNLSYSLPYPLPYPTSYPTLPYTLPYPTLPYPTLPYPTLPYPYPLPYPTLSLPPTLPYHLPWIDLLTYQVCI